MAEFVLEMRGVTKRFHGVVALDDVSFALRSGEVHGLLGGNGAGKSTLMKILAGALPMDAGEILIEDYPALITSPRGARELGVGVVFQECGLVPRLSVAENIFLGRAPRRGRRGPVSWRRMHEDARAVLDRLGMDLDTRRPVGELGAAPQKLVEIAKALSFDARIIVMDEPSAPLTGHELETLFRLVKLLRRGGVGVVYISQRPEELSALAQRVTVMRDGKRVATRDMCDTTRDELICMMAGSEPSEGRP
jgi:ribose transport system ATP-binding protein